jgi:APA family basic amino acid/polyamine antiporter
MALSAMALGNYVHAAFPVLPAGPLAVGALLLVSISHLAGVGPGARFQNLSTVLKLVPILALAAAGLLLPAGAPVAPRAGSTDWAQVLTPAFAVSLVYVSYAYSGWNASTYLSGEIADPRRNVPRSVIGGTLLVTALYVTLNYVFLRAVPLPDLEGKLEVGALAAHRLFGEGGRRLVVFCIGLGLLSTISSMVLAGSRVLQTVGEDFPALGFFASRGRTGGPRAAVVFQALLALAMLLTATFDQVLTYIGFTLSLFTVATVGGVFILRARGGAPQGAYRTWGYPFTPLVFLVFNVGMIVFLLQQKPRESLAGLVTLALGGVFYALISPAGRAGTVSPLPLPPVAISLEEKP